MTISTAALKKTRNKKHSSEMLIRNDEELCFLFPLLMLYNQRGTL